MSDTHGTRTEEMFPTLNLSYIDLCNAAWQLRQRAIFLEQQLSAERKRADEAEADAERWRMLPAFLEKHQINYVLLKRDIDEAMKNG
jgi:hypothetical protein